MPNVPSPQSADDIDLANAVRLHRSGQHALAEAKYRAVLSRVPNHPPALNYLGTLLAGSGRFEEGIELLRRSVKHSGQSQELYLNLADALSASGRTDAAESTLKKALQIKRGPEALAKLGVIMIRQGKLRPGGHHLEQALAMAPESIDIRCNLAVVKAQTGETISAYSLLTSALALAPAHLDALNSIASLKRSEGEFPIAAAWFRRALAREQTFAPAHGNISTVLAALGQRSSGIRHGRAALALMPHDNWMWSNFGTLVLEGGKPAEAEAALRRAVQIMPSSAGAWSNYGRALNAQGRFAEAIKSYRYALNIDPFHAAAFSNLLFLSHFDPTFTPKRIFEEHVAFGRRHEASLRKERRPHPNSRDPARRLRIGYVSADFGKHPVGFFLKPILIHHDPKEVEVICYSDRAVEDDTTAEFREASSVFRRTIGLTDAALADQVRQDRIDVLIDLAGHTSGNRLLVFAQKPAPVQVSWLGYYDTTGLRSIDAVLADPWEVEPGDERWYVENVIRLSTGRLCYSPPATAPDVTSPPRERHGATTFGCFNNVAKLTDATLIAWGRILEQVSDARLLLRSPPLADATYRARLIERCRRLGLPPERIDMAASTPQQILMEYGKVDLALDPFPFPGGLTTCESLWMGVPVVTLKGEYPVTRQSVSFLARVGLPDLVATSIDDYVELSVSLARSPNRLAGIRRNLRPTMAASALTDGHSAARSIEAAFRSLWRAWCSS